MQSNSGHHPTPLFGTSVSMVTPFYQHANSFHKYGEYSYDVSWSLMKEIKTKLKSPLFYFHGNCDKVCPIDSDFFGWSRSTRCGCRSYQVSSISVRWVTCYDNFCVFQLFCILAVSMATAAILKKINPSKHNFTWHMIFLQGFITFDQGISKKSSGQKCVEEE